MENQTREEIAAIVATIGTAECWQGYSSIILNSDVDGQTFCAISRESLVALGFLQHHAEAVVRARDRILAQPGAPVRVNPVPGPTRPRFVFWGRNAVLSSNNTILRKLNGQNVWDVAALADGPSNIYRVRVIAGPSTMIGFATNSISLDGKNYETSGYYMQLYAGRLFSQLGDFQKDFLGPCAEPGTVIECIWDAERGEIWFGLQGTRKLAYRNIPTNRKLFLAFNLGDAGSGVELLA